MFTFRYEQMNEKKNFKKYLRQIVIYNDGFLSSLSVKIKDDQKVQHNLWEATPHSLKRFKIYKGQSKIFNPDV